VTPDRSPNPITNSPRRDGAPAHIDLGPLVAGWPVTRVAAATVSSSGPLGLVGDPDWKVRVASVSKLLVTLAVLVAVEEETVELDERVDTFEGVTLRHLLSHASGIDFSRHRRIAPPGTRRVYSNVGIGLAADHLALRAGMPFSTYLAHAVFEPLGMADSELVGSPAHDVHSTVADLRRFAAELLVPSLISAATLQQATTPQFPSLAGVLPGIGRFDPNPWGLGFEIKGDKNPHWSGALTSARTFGHFGGSGTFLWVDPVRGMAAIALTEREFDGWAMDFWPSFSDAVLAGTSS
jgi:CubicO group peptidase (beta-lactamase class C family)